MLDTGKTKVFLNYEVSKLSDMVSVVVIQLLPVTFLVFH